MFISAVQRTALKVDTRTFTNSIRQPKNARYEHHAEASEIAS